MIKYLLIGSLLFLFSDSSRGSVCLNQFKKGPAYSLFLSAKKAREKAYAPYSQYLVGAAIGGKNGDVFCGCNVENASYSNTLCAETTAIGNMILAGQKKIKEMVVLGECKKGKICTPCGSCRQKIKELGAKGAKVHVYDPVDGYKTTYTVEELLPHPFSL